MLQQVKELKVKGRGTMEMDHHKAQKPQQNSGLGLVGSIFGVSGTSIEVDQKMNSILEETLLQNIQLQGDVRLMGEEVSKLSEENKSLKTQIETFKSKGRV